MTNFHLKKKHESLHQSEVIPLWDASKQTTFYCLLRGGGGNAMSLFIFSTPSPLFILLHRRCLFLFLGKCALIYLISQTVLVMCLLLTGCHGYIVFHPLHAW